MYSGLSAMRSEVSVSAGQWQFITADIEPWNLRTAIQMCEITVINGGSGVFGFYLQRISAGGEADMSVADAFLTFGFTADSGEASYSESEKNYNITPGRDGIITLRADVVHRNYTPESGLTALKIVLDNAADGGVISLAVADGFASSSNFIISSTCPVYYGENTYLLPFSSAITLRAYRLSFHNLYPDVGESVTLRSVSIVSFPSEEEIDYAGKITECALSSQSNTLEIAGSLSAAIAAEYIHAEIALFEYPMWKTDADLYSEEPILRIPMSTRFSFSLDLTGREHTVCASRYQAAILQGGARIPVASAVYPKFGSSPEKGALSVIGLHGTDTEEVFNSNASSVILDVYVDRLLGGAEGNTSGRLCVRGGQYYYLDNVYIRELDAEINFCLAADVEVYLRLLCATDLFDKGYTLPCLGAKFFAFDVRNPAGASMLGAITEFLASRYQGISGFIAGQRLDAALYNGADMSDPEAYANLCADTMRLIYNSAAVHIPDIIVIAPIGHDKAEADAALTPSYTPADFSCDPVILTTLLSRSILRDGIMPWGLLYMSDEVGKALGHMQNILSQMRTVSSPLPDATMLLWHPHTDYSPEILLMEYSDRCYSATRNGIRVLFLSLENVSEDEQKNICASLKYTLDGTEYRRPLSEHRAEILTTAPLYAGKYTLGNFTNSYSTLGWIAGSGCARLLTQAALSGSGRSLHAAFESEDGTLFTPVSGNILWVSGVTDNFRHAPHIIYTVQATTALESADRAELVFIFGSGDMRAEYAVTIPTGVEVDILCDLSEFSGADTVDFMAVSLRCDSEISLDITEIVCCSSEYSDTVLENLYRYRTAATADRDSSAQIFTQTQRTLLIVVFFGSILALALFGRRKGGKNES